MIRGLQCILLLLTLITCARAQNASALLAGTPDAFLTACRADLTSARSQLDLWKADKGPRDAYATLQAFDTLELVAGDAQARASLAEQVHPDKAFRDAAQTCEQEAVSVITNISLDPAAYGVLAAVKNSKLDPAATYYLRTTLRDYHRAGVDRDEPTREKIRQLQDDLIKIGQEFEQNIADDVRKITLDPSQLDGLPEDFKRSHPADASGKVTLKTDNTDYVPFMQYAKDDDARKSFYVLYQERAYPKNIEVLHRLLTKRYELAKLLGYSDWAAYITEDKMVASKQNAADFIDKISATTQNGSRRDYQDLLAFKKRTDPNATVINPWEWLYLERGTRIEKFGFDSQDGTALSRILAGEARHSRLDEPDVRHHLQADKRRESLASGCAGLRRVRRAESNWAHLLRYVSPRQQVQALRDIQSHHRETRPTAAGIRAGMQLPTAGRE